LAVDLQRNAVDRDRDHAAVLADPPVAFDADRLAALGGMSDRAVLHRVWRPVRVLVVDRVVARPADQLVVAVESQCPDGRVVDERHPVVPVHQPQRDLTADHKRLLHVAGAPAPPPRPVRSDASISHR
jgi:hypothetical protein